MTYPVYGDIIIIGATLKEGEKMNIKRISALICAIAVVLTSDVSASILGAINGGWQTDMGGGAVYTNGVYKSESGTNQTENYVEYTPNAEAVPIVVNGSSVYGKRTITSASEYMEKNNLRPLIGINGDFFSTKTGIPMGYTVIDGKLLSKEAGVQDAVGFRADGTGFIDKIGIDASLTHDDKKINIQYVNKWPQDGFECVYMLDSNFSTTTKTDFNAIYVICSATSGDLSLDSSMQLKVDEVYIHDGAIKIPDGKYVFVMDPDGDAQFFDLLSNLAPGDELTFSNSVYGAERHNWTEAKHIMSSIGGRLLNNGVTGSGFETGTAPRTAVGIKENGNIIFYTIDGRQSGYSTGITIKTLASRMSELGCVDAINLDGGGSTAIGGVFPGFEDFVVSNRPSDGVERKCANYLFLQDLRKKTGIVWFVDWRESDNYNFLAGTQYQLEALKVYDTGNYKMDGLSGITFTAENEGDAQATVDSAGLVTFRGTGGVTVNVTGERYSKVFKFETYESPDEVRILDEATGGAVSELTVCEGGMANFSLEAGAYVNNVRLNAYPSLFRWETVGSVASVDEDGTVSVKDNGTGNGAVRVAAGGVTKEIPIKVVPKPVFEDTKNHWAKETIEKMASEGVINGFYENGVSLFRPDSNITRIQFAALVSKAMGISDTDYAFAELRFTDSDKIQPWAVGYVKAMSKLGYISGRSDDNGKTVYFDPESTITRAEAFTIIGRILGAEGDGKLGFTDSDKVPEWARAAVATLTNSGVIQGFEDNTIRPNNPITRAESAILIDKSGI